MPVLLVASASERRTSLSRGAGRVPRRARRYSLVARLIAATKKASTPQVSVRNHGRASQYGYDNHPGWKLATTKALAAHNPAP
jgi:hypothetical protein